MQIPLNPEIIEENKEFNPTAALDIEAATKEPFEFWINHEDHLITYHITQDGHYLGATIAVNKHNVRLNTQDGKIDGYCDPYIIINDKMQEKLAQFYYELYEEDRDKTNSTYYFKRKTEGAHPCPPKTTKSPS